MRCFDFFKKPFLLGLFFFIGVSGFSQDDTLTCETGINKALQDFENDIYNSHPTEPLNINQFGPKIDAVYWGNEVEIAKSKYNINLKSRLEFKTPHNECYALKMDSLIKEKYGDSIFYLISYEANIDCSFEPTKDKDGYPIYSVVDTMPEFKGGTDSLVTFIGKNIQHQNHTFGTVYCSFVINIDGSLSDIKIEKGVNEYADEEVMRLIKSMPKWSPGVLNGEKVRVKWTLPIKFTG